MRLAAISAGFDRTKLALLLEKLHAPSNSRFHQATLDDLSSSGFPRTTLDDPFLKSSQGSLAPRFRMDSPSLEACRSADGDSGTEREDEQRDDEAPEVELASVTERMQPRVAGTHGAFRRAAGPRCRCRRRNESLRSSWKCYPSKGRPELGRGNEHVADQGAMTKTLLSV